MTRFATSSLLLASLVLLTSSCAYFSKYGSLTRRSKSDFSSGRYASAVESVVHALRIKPDYVPAQTEVVHMVPQAKSILLSRIERVKQQSVVFKDDNTVTQRKRVVDDYEQLIRVMKAAASLPPFVHKETGQAVKFSYEDFTGQLATAKNAHQESIQQAAELHYNRGVALAAKNDKASAREAAAEFKRALEYVPNYRDAMVKYMLARGSGTAHVGLLGVDTESAWPLGTAVEKPVEQALFTGIMAKSDNLEFTSFVNQDTMKDSVTEHGLDLAKAYNVPEHAKSIGKLLGLDQVMVVSVTKLAVPPAVARVIQQGSESASIPNGTTTYQDQYGNTQTRQAYTNIYANVATHQKSTTATITVGWKLIDCQSGKVLAKNESSANKTWQSETWKTHTGGDQRALCYATKQSIEKGEPAGPDEKALAVEIAQQAVPPIITALMPRFK